MHARSFIPLGLIAIIVATSSWSSLRASSGCPNVTFDGLGNVAVNSVDCATVSGGNNNTATGSYVTISGGKDNIAGGLYATIGGGFSHSVGGNTATISGGYDNNASGITATVGGGFQNSASA